MKEVIIPPNCEGMKAEKFVKKYLSEAPLSFIYKAFRKKDIKVNGHWIKEKEVLHSGDVLRIYVTDQQLEDFSKPRPVMKKELEYPIVYEDENVLIIDKPAGLLVVPDDKGNKATLGAAVLDYLYLKGEYSPDSVFVPSPAHRLDRNTSGLVCFGKTDAGLKALTELFKERTGIHKRYLAFVVGDIEKGGEINKPLKKDSETGKVSVCSISCGGKSALTKYEVVDRHGNFTLVDVELLTGRTHQIRVHFASIGHPLVGDEKYGDFAANRMVKSLTGVSNQFLHAYKLSFDELSGALKPLSNKTFESGLPANIKQAIGKLVNNN